MGLTRDICNIIHATNYESLGEEWVRRVKQAIKDGIAVALAEGKEPPVTILTEHLLSLGELPQTSIWSGSQGLRSAGRLHQFGATHVLDFEPMWSPPTHSVSPTVPVAFALAEISRASALLANVGSMTKATHLRQCRCRRAGCGTACATGFSGSTQGFHLHALP